MLDLSSCRFKLLDRGMLYLVSAISESFLIRKNEGLYAEK